tara:strand:+ start:5238 stop:10166 length:4929 start_codon:yes stop_codon:yes gene_type:complete
MNPYSQLHMMQQAGAGQFIPGLGTMGPMVGGASTLQAMSREMGSPIAGTPMVDTSPMSSLNYQGPGSGIANLAGNLLLTPMMQSQGMLPLGNASYMQAQRQNQFYQMQGEVLQGVAGQDTEGIFRSIRGGAALAGVPMDREQTRAAREFAQTMAEQAPLLDLFVPGLMDTMAGEAGSVQKMAAQVTNANRYNMDPSTGKLGFSGDSNKQMIEGLFESMFNQDNIVKMQGLRAGEMGEVYSRMSAEGLAGPKGNLRDRTIGAIRDIQNEGGDVAVDGALGALGSYDSGNLEKLSNKDLATLRDTSSTVSDRITEADTDRISGQLQDYVKSLSAIREVFGENGNPNAPIPELIGALEALTSNKMQQFDATRLNTMVRDMQALSQASGKSIDQMTAMQQHSSADINKMIGYGGEHFAATSMGYGVTTGQGFQQVGGARGFGALSRTEAEAASQSLFNRSMSSEMANTLGAISRLEDTGSIPEEGPGKTLRNAMTAVRQGDEFYTDNSNNRRRTPTRENEFRKLISEGGAGGVDVSDFNLFLGQTFANREALAGDQDLQKGAVRQQFFEFEREANKSAANATMKLSAFEGVDASSKGSAALSISRAANAAMFDLTPEDFADKKLRERVAIEAIQAEAAGIAGLELNESESKSMASIIIGQNNSVAKRRTGLSALGLMQTQGTQVSNAQRSAESQSQALSKQNEAMSVLGQKGTGMRRLFTALQKQGDMGEDADLNTLIGDIFGAEDINAGDLSESMQEVKELIDKSDDLRGRLVGAPPDERRSIEKELSKVNADLMGAAETAQTEGRRLGVNAESGTFNLEDNRRVSEALSEIDARTDRSGLRDFIKNDYKVSDKELEDVAGELTSQDIANLDKAAGTTSSKPELTDGVVDKEKMKQALDGMNSSAARSRFTPQLLIDSTLHKQLGPAFEAIRNDPQQLRNAIATGEAVMADDKFNENTRPVFEQYQSKAEDRLKELEAKLEAEKKSADPAAKDYSKLEAGGLTAEEKETVLRGRKLTELDKGSTVTGQAIEKRMVRIRRKADPDRTEFNEDENAKAFKESRMQLRAERGLQAIGVISKDENLLDAADLDLKNAGISKEVAELISSGDPKKQLEAVQKIAAGSQQKAREINNIDIDKGNTVAVAENLSVLSATADEYLMDTEALIKGGSVGEAAARDMQEALSDLQSLANKHSLQKGDLGSAELLQAGVSGIKDAADVQDKINAVRVRIKEAAAGMQAGTQNDYKNVTSVTDEQKEKAQEALGGGLSDAQVKAYSLLEKTSGDVTQENVDSLAGNLVKLQGADEADIATIDKQMRAVSTAAGAYGRSELKGVMTKEEYQDAVTGKDNKRAKELTLFDGNEATLSTVEKLMADRKRQQGTLSRTEKLVLREDKNQADVAKARGTLSETQEEIAKFAADSGISPEELTKAMSYQRDLQKLKARHIEGDFDEGKIEAIGTLKEVALQEKEKQEKLSKPEGIIHKALGFNSSQDIDLELGSSEDNKRMLAEELQKLETIGTAALGLDAGATAIEKLDRMQDKYSAAETVKEKDALAKELGLDRKQLDRSMARTDFMNLDEVDLSRLDPEKQADYLQRRLKSVETRSLEKEVQSDEDKELRVTGTLQCRGDFSGEAILSDVIGLTSAAGTV